MKQNMLMPSTLFVIFFLISFTSRLSSATVPSEHLTEKEKQKLVAIDSIVICLHEVDDASKYINAIPNLKSIQFTKNPKLLPCIQGLNSDLSKVKLALDYLRYLKGPYILSYEHSLKHTSSHAINLGNTCSSLLQNEDKVVVSVLTRKLDDLSYLINNVVYHVSEFLGETKTPGSH